MTPFTLDLACRIDPAQIMRSAGLTPDPWQARLLRSEPSHTLLLSSRQIGKSTVTGAMALKQALFHPGSLILVLSVSQRQSGELLRRVLDFYSPLSALCGVKAESVLHIEFRNGSRIITLPGNESTIRGYSKVNLLIIDEASEVPDQIYYTVRPMLAISHGHVIALSTPKGKRGWFYYEYDQGGAGWNRVKVMAEMCARMTPEFLAEEKRKLPAWFFEQEYHCIFADTEDQLISEHHIAAAFQDDVEAFYAN